ncbi:hypothetical protein HAALTHF_39510n [Vreelandella aquamarina]|nr:hypothetical protein HAALTHF_39510n [Halomonas axialensis]
MLTSSTSIRASWLFPLYLLLINLFVIPIALAGLLLGEGDPDSFVLTLPLSAGLEGLPLLVFIGGLSAATGMVIVETIALSTMVSNQLIMPLLLKVKHLYIERHGRLADWLLNIRRIAILLILLMGYLYHALIGDSYSLVTIGLVSFAGVAQFAPALLIGLYWRGATRQGGNVRAARWIFYLVLYAAAAGVCTVGLAERDVNYPGPLGNQLAITLTRCWG